MEDQPENYTKEEEEVIRQAAKLIERWNHELAVQMRAVVREQKRTVVGVKRYVLPISGLSEDIDSVNHPPSEDVQQDDIYLIRTILDTEDK